MRTFLKVKTLNTWSSDRAQGAQDLVQDNVRSQYLNKLQYCVQNIWSTA